MRTMDKKRIQLSLPLDRGKGIKGIGLKILHFADLHLGVESYGHIDPASSSNL
ncbi:hypothetical protein ACFLUU_05110 [Chloroflexota bacterium]